MRKADMVNMHYQLKRLWSNAEAYARTFGYNRDWAWRRELVNNNTWLNNLSVMEYLRVLGSSVRLGTMLGKQTSVSPLYSKK